MTVAQLVTEVKKDEIVFKHSHGGVTISGGEPLFVPGFALKLLRAFKQAGINTGVDTSGQIPWSGLEPVLPYVDFFLWDIKHMDPQQHKQLTGVSNELILSMPGLSLHGMFRSISGYRSFPAVTILKKTSVPPANSSRGLLPWLKSALCRCTTLAGRGMTA